MLQQLSPQERKRFWLISTVIVLALGLWLFFFPNGGMRYLELRQEIASVQAETDDLNAHNKALAEEAVKLEKDPSYLEGVARQEYGLVRKNEIVFEFPKRRRRH